MQKLTCHRRLPVWFYRITGSFPYAFSVLKSQRVTERIFEVISNFVYLGGALAARHNVVERRARVTASIPVLMHTYSNTPSPASCVRSVLGGGGGRGQLHTVSVFHCEAVPGRWAVALGSTKEQAKILSLIFSSNKKNCKNHQRLYSRFQWFAAKFAESSCFTWGQAQIRPKNENIQKKSFHFNGLYLILMSSFLICLF